MPIGKSCLSVPTATECRHGTLDTEKVRQPGRMKTVCSLAPITGGEVVQDEEEDTVEESCPFSKVLCTEFFKAGSC